MSDISRTTIKRIYDRIPEELSRRIYADRLLYSMTADRACIRRIVSYTPGGGQVYERMSRFRRFILFGGGIWGGNILWAFPDADWLFAWDNAPKKNTLVSDNKGFSEEKVEIPVEKYVPGAHIAPDTAVVISSRLYHAEIYHQLTGDGIPEEQIIDAGGIVDDLSKRQYFDLPQMERSEDEVFVDAGAFDGETSVQFHKYYSGRYGGIIAFEPDGKNALKFQEKTGNGGCHDVTLVRQGLWDEKTELSFTSIGNGRSMIDTGGEVKILVDRLDDMVPPGMKVSFIKMDLEGAELRALKGAECTIRERHPKLAISLYHRPEDVWEIPDLILSYNPDYTFYLRHYSIAASETVLYAV